MVFRRIARVVRRRLCPKMERNMRNWIYALTCVVAAVWLGWSDLPLIAQSTGVLVVSSCGNQTFTAGRTVAPLTVDTTGRLCDSGTGTATITGTVTISGTPVVSLTGTANVNAGQSGNWNVGGYEFQLAPTITVQTGTYSAGNSLGGLITATGAARTAGGSGILDGLRLKSTGGGTETVWVYAWSKTPAATCTDKSAYVANTADTPYALVGFPMQTTLGGNPGSWDTATYANLTGLVNNFVNQDGTPSTNLYFCVVTAGATTPATTSDLSMSLGGIRD
jgi:hypothetical protein